MRCKIKFFFLYDKFLILLCRLDALSTTNNNRLKYVFSGPPKAQGKKLYYIYGTDPSAKDKGIHHEEYKPQGKGYNWPQSYRKANNLYYDILFTEKGMGKINDFYLFLAANTLNI